MGGVLTTDSIIDARPAPPYLNCPRCGLSIALRSRLVIRHCPRCLGRTRTVVELFSSQLPTDVLYANNSRPGTHRRTGR
jgi:hypothetical protein